LDENFSRLVVNVWRGPPTDRLLDQRCTLKRQTADVSSKAVSMKISSPRESGPQGLRRPRFSFFLFTFQTAREPWRSPLPGQPESRRSSCIRELSDADSLFQW